MIDKRPPKLKMRAVLLFGLGLLMATMACTCAAPTGFLSAPVEEGSVETAVAQTIEAGQAVEQQVQQTVAAALAAQQAVAEAPAETDLADPNAATPITTSQPVVEANLEGTPTPTLAATWTPTTVSAAQATWTPTSLPAAQATATATPLTPTHTPTSAPTNTPEPTQLTKTNWQVDFLYRIDDDQNGSKRLQVVFNQNGGVLSGSNRDSNAEVDIVTTGMVTGNTVTITFTMSNGGNTRGSVTCTGTINAGPPQTIAGSFTAPSNLGVGATEGSCAFR
jgi:hypothetical protein